MNAVRSRRFRFKFMALAPLLAAVALTSWAFASPVGSSPDDDFHLASTWCATGNVAHECQAVSDQGKRAVPGALIKGRCFAGKGELSAACLSTSPHKTQNGLVATNRVNLRGFYPPLYYLSMHLFVTSNIAVSVVLMRIVNILLFVGLATAIYVLLPAHRRLSLVWGLAMTLVPLGLFLVASNNPSGWAAISAGTLWISLVGYFESSGARKAGLGAVAAVSTVLGAGARADSAVYAVVAVVVAVLLTGRLNRRWLVSAILPLVLAAMAVVLLLSASQSGVPASGLHSDPRQALSWHQLLFTNFLNVPSLWSGVFGSWQLGWLDTPMPAIVWVGALSAFAVLAFAGLVWMSARKLLAIATVLGALWVIPTYILVKSGVLVGHAVQPRYILPLIILLGGVALFQVGGERLKFSKAQVVVIICTLSVANATALHFNMRRYITGTTVTGWDLNTAAQWWWNIPFSPMMVWAVGSLSFAAFLVVIAVGTMRVRAAAVVPHPQAAPTTAAHRAGGPPWHHRFHRDVSAGQAVTR